MLYNSDIYNIGVIMNVTQMINNEEYFAYLVSSGKSKAEALPSLKIRNVS